MSGKKVGSAADEGAATKRSFKKGIGADKARSNDQENAIAEDYREAGFPKAKRVIMSGAIAAMPSDVDPGSMMLVEAKRSRSGKLTVEHSWLVKVQKDAEAAGRDAGVLHGWIATHDSTYGKFVVVPEAFWFKILEQYKFMEKELGIGS